MNTSMLLALALMCPLAVGCAATDADANADELEMGEDELQAARYDREGTWSTVAIENAVGMMSSREIARAPHGAGRVAVAFNAPVGPDTAPGMKGRVVVRLPDSMGSEILRFSGDAQCSATTTEEGYLQGKLGTLQSCSIRRFVDGHMWSGTVTIDTLHDDAVTISAGASELVAIPTPPALGNVFQSTVFTSN